MVQQRLFKGEVVRIAGRVQDEMNRNGVQLEPRLSHDARRFRKACSNWSITPEAGTRKRLEPG